MDTELRKKLNSESSSVVTSEASSQKLDKGKYKHKKRKTNTDLDFSVHEYTHTDGPGYRINFYKEVGEDLYMKTKVIGPLTDKFKTQWTLIDEPR